jgi:hypothetical protein
MVETTGRSPRVLARRSDTKDNVLRDHEQYKLTEAARLLNISYYRLRQLIDKGIVRLATLPGQPHIWGAELRRVMEATSPEAGEAS